MRRLLFLLTSAVVLAGCGSASDDSGDAAKPAADKPASTEEKKSSQAARGTTIKLVGSQFGKVLFDGRGQAIYTFEKEKSHKSECYDECAAAWPPVLTAGEPGAAAGIDEALVGTTKRRDGKTQVTYDGHPLYFYAHEGRNEVKCHNVTEFG